MKKLVLQVVGISILAYLFIMVAWIAMYYIDTKIEPKSPHKRFSADSVSHFYELASLVLFYEESADSIDQNIDGLIEKGSDPDSETIQSLRESAQRLRDRAEFIRRRITGDLEAIYSVVKVPLSVDL